VFVGDEVGWQAGGALFADTATDTATGTSVTSPLSSLGAAVSSLPRPVAGRRVRGAESGWTAVMSFASRRSFRLCRRWDRCGGGAEPVQEGKDRADLGGGNPVALRFLDVVDVERHCEPVARRVGTCGKSEVVASGELSPTVGVSVASSGC
jgi:hypothetical protein